MVGQSVLGCGNMGQKLQLDLCDQPPLTSSVDFSTCDIVYEDGWYDISFTCSELNSNDVDYIIIKVNGDEVGVVESKEKKDQKFLEFSNNALGQIFLLRYDLVIVSFLIVMNNGQSIELYSNYLLCISQHQDDIDNINHMIKELSEFDNSQINEWIFSCNNSKIGFYEGKWHRNAYRSLNSYIQLLEDIVICYKNNFSYFKLMGKHTIKKNSILQSYQNVKSITVDSFQWLMQNSHQFSEISDSSGISYLGKNYIPLMIKSEVSQKSWDVYENKIVICFLYTVLNNAKLVYNNFEKEIVNEERVLLKINGTIPKKYSSSILTIKSIQVSLSRTLICKLEGLIETLVLLYNQYMSLFDVKIFNLTSLPKKTKTFQEIKPYVQVFSKIVKWFNYGEFSLEKDKLILQVKTLDKLFEYFCLIQLLKVFAENGFIKSNLENSVYNYEYIASDNLYQNEKDIANTYILNKENIDVTIYFQPIISANQFQNNLNLYRTTKPYRGSDYYSPDFVIKFSFSEDNEKYVIFDSKFSSRKNIRNYYLFDVLRKYSLEVATKRQQDSIDMVWILQGRVLMNEDIVWKLHNSPLALSYIPKTSFGIISVNTISYKNYLLWNEIRKIFD